MERLSFADSLFLCGNFQNECCAIGKTGRKGKPMFDNCYQYLLSRIAVCESAKELNKLTCVWPCSLTEDEISSLEEAKRLLLNIIVRREEERTHEG